MPVNCNTHPESSLLDILYARRDHQQQKQQCEEAATKQKVNALAIRAEAIFEWISVNLFSFCYYCRRFWCYLFIYNLSTLYFCHHNLFPVSLWLSRSFHLLPPLRSSRVTHTERHSKALGREISLFSYNVIIIITLFCTYAPRDDHAYYSLLFHLILYSSWLQNGIYLWYRSESAPTFR